MPNLSRQFLFALGTGTTTATSVSIPGTAISPYGDRTFYSDKEKGDGYYNMGDGVHTVTYTVSPAFDGIINVQGTLALTPTDTDWFNIVGTSVAFSQLSETTITNYVNFTGNIVWVRAKVTRNVDDVNTNVLVINYNH